MYTSPKEVEIVRNAEALGKAYEIAFERRYHTKPFIENEELVVFSFLSKNFGLKKGMDIVQTYIRSEDEWFVKNAHSIAVLRKNIHKVLAYLGTLSERRAQNDAIRILVHTNCAKCKAPSDWIGDVENIDDIGPVFCKNCQLENNADIS